jgi:hypothetical protein
MHGTQQVSPESGGFRIEVAGVDLSFREIRVVDPVPTGRQIIEAAGGHPAEDFVLLQWLPDQDIEDIELDETTDLRASGAERFIFAKSDRTYLFEIDGRRHQWPEPTITREVLIELAGQDPAKFSVWQELRNSPDKEIVSGQPATLDTAGLEKFYTVMTHTTEGLL